MPTVSNVMRALIPITLSVLFAIIYVELRTEAHEAPLARTPQVAGSNAGSSEEATRQLKSLREDIAAIRTLLLRVDENQADILDNIGDENAGMDWTPEAVSNEDLLDAIKNAVSKLEGATTGGIDSIIQEVKLVKDQTQDVKTAIVSTADNTKLLRQTLEAIPDMLEGIKPYPLDGDPSSDDFNISETYTCSEYFRVSRLDRSLPTYVLASYPRAGNSWTRHMIEMATGYLTGGIYFDTRLWRAGLRAEGLMDGVVLVKTHRRETKLVDFYYVRNKLKPPESEVRYCKKAIYLMRYPYDSFQSLFDLDRTKSHVTVMFVRDESDWDHHVDWAAGEFRSMVEYWLNPDPYCPTMFVRYEDLKNDTEFWLRKMLDYMGVVIDENRLKCAIWESGCKSAKDCRRGEFGASLPFYTEEQKERLCNTLGDLTEYFGYQLPYPGCATNASSPFHNKKLFTKVLEPSLSLEQQKYVPCMGDSPFRQGLKRMQLVRERAAKMVEGVDYNTPTGRPLIFLWKSASWPAWGEPPGMNPWAGIEIHKKYPLDCDFTRDMELYANASLVIFEPPGHIHKHKGKFCNVSFDWPENKFPYQKWAMFHYEQPEQFPILGIPEYVNLFDWTMTYDQNSTLQMTLSCLWGSDYTLEDLRRPVDMSKKQPGHVAVYFASRCQAYRRDGYVADMMKHMKVHSYGKCLHNADMENEEVSPWPRNWWLKIDEMSKFKFALAFENANKSDWITEKLIHAFMAGTVPVVMSGDPIEDWIPSYDSIIHIRDFESPEKLAERLVYLNEHEDEYMKYFEWKNRELPQKFLRTLNNCAFWGEERICEAVKRSQRGEDPREDVTQPVDTNFAAFNPHALKEEYQNLGPVHQRPSQPDFENSENNINDESSSSSSSSSSSFTNPMWENSELSSSSETSSSSENSEDNSEKSSLEDNSDENSSLSENYGREDSSSSFENSEGSSSENSENFSSSENSENFSSSENSEKSSSSENSEESSSSSGNIEQSSAARFSDMDKFSVEPETGIRV